MRPPLHIRAYNATELLEELAAKLDLMCIFKVNLQVILR